MKCKIIFKETIFKNFAGHPCKGNVLHSGHRLFERFQYDFERDESDKQEVKSLQPGELEAMAKEILALPQQTYERAVKKKYEALG